jgi:hypothetical protein
VTVTPPAETVTVTVTAAAEPRTSATQAAPPPATTVAAPPAATTAAAPPPATTADPPAPAGCHPLTNSGNCYQPGEFCRATDHGASGIDDDGNPIVCRDNNGWRWEPA